MLLAGFSCDYSLTWIIGIKNNWANGNNWKGKCCKPSWAYGSTQSPPLCRVTAGWAVGRSRGGNEQLQKVTASPCMGLCRTPNTHRLQHPLNIYPVKKYLKPITLLKLWLLCPSLLLLPRTQTPSRAELGTLTFVSQNPTVQGFPLRRNRNWLLASTYGVHLSCSSRQHTLQELSVSEIKQQIHSLEAQGVTCNPQLHLLP